MASARGFQPATRTQVPGSSDKILPACVFRLAICKKQKYEAATRPDEQFGRTSRNRHRRTQNGAIAQLGERLHGMQEVSGSIPLSSTIFHDAAISVLISNGCAE